MGEVVEGDGIASVVKNGVIQYNHKKSSRGNQCACCNSLLCATVGVIVEIPPTDIHGLSS